VKSIVEQIRREVRPLKKRQIFEIWAQLGSASANAIPNGRKTVDFRSPVFTDFANEDLAHPTFHTGPPVGWQPWLKTKFRAAFADVEKSL